MPYKTEIAKIPMDQISIGQSQVRTEPNAEKIQELANNIERNGLINPITLRKIGDGSYEVIAGQMRFLACQKLGHTEINANIIENLDDMEAMSISFVENLLRSDPSEKEYIDACHELYKRYGSVKAVADELKIKESYVRRYIKYPRLPDALKKFYDDGKIDLNYALQITDASTDENGKIDHEKAEKLASKMVELGGKQQKNVAETAKKMKASSVDDILEKSKEAQNVKRVSLQLSEDLYAGLSSYAQEHDKEPQQAALDLVTQGLASQGFVDEDS